MYEIAEQIGAWVTDGRDVRVATVVATRGFSSRDPAATAAWTEGQPPIGHLVDGVAVEPTERTGLVDITVGEDEAAAAGLACAGVATVLVQPARAYPAELWGRLTAREPLCLITTLRDGASVTDVHTAATIREAYEANDQLARLFARGTTAVSLQPGETTTVAVALWPVPTLVVVGDGLIADALHGAATLLGWRTQVEPERDPALAAVGGLYRSDAVVVLSHDRAVDGPVLAAALAGEAGYVGALGSRRTQAARREWLTGHGVLGKDQARIHGPAGLDIDAHTPGEIAVSIVAEIIAGRGGSPGGALRDRTGPVHGAGVHAPPPRY